MRRVPLPNNSFFPNAAGSLTWPPACTTLLTRGLYFLITVSLISVFVSVIFVTHVFCVLVWLTVNGPTFVSLVLVVLTQVPSSLCSFLAFTCSFFLVSSSFLVSQSIT